MDKFAAYISQLEERLTYFTDLHTEHEVCGLGAAQGGQRLCWHDLS